MANARRIVHCAAIVDKYIKEGLFPVVVVSAMAGTTNNLQGYTDQILVKKQSPHHDVVLSAGEQINIGLFAMALEKINIKAQTFLGWQLPIITNNVFTRATILKIDTKKIYECQESSIVPVIAGFQGVTQSQEITTIGRGGSDTAAVYLADALDRCECHIFSDVEGVFAVDPKIVTYAHKIEVLTYDEMLEMSSHGSKVLAFDAAYKARENQVNVKILSTFIEGQGTKVVCDINDLYRAVALSVNEEENALYIIGKNIASQIKRCQDLFNDLCDDGRVNLCSMHCIGIKFKALMSKNLIKTLYDGIFSQTPIFKKMVAPS